MAWHAAGARAAIGAGAIVRREIAGTAIVLVRAGDAVAVYLDVCPHEGHPLSEGSIEEGVLICAKHLWEFDLLTGTHVSRVPKPQFDLRRVPVRVGADGNLEVELT